MDRLALELSVPFQHVHYEAGEKPVGEEYYIQEYPRKNGVDGAFSYEGELALFEFHGDYWHGHPRKHGKGAMRMYQKRETSFEEIFADTERIMRKVVERTGMRLFYVWEWDYDCLKEGAPVWPIVREFKGALEW
jgi:hypothetical protein